VDRERRLRVAQFDMAERAMPPVVDFQEVALLRPEGLARGDPGKPVRGTALHFHDMGDGMMSPAVPGVGIDGHAPGIFRLGVCAGLLEAEGVHPEHEGPARHALPMRQGAGDPVAQGPRVGAQEVEQMPRLKRDRRREDAPPRRAKPWRPRRPPARWRA
jgi:hypothetical protein